jgi:hypothetical protein
MVREPASPPAQSEAERLASKRRIEEEHRRLHQLMLAVTQETDLATLGTLLADLEALLVEHFASEEGPQGMHEIVSAGAAHRLPDLQRLFGEHRAILLQLAELRGEIAGLLAGPIRRVHQEVVALAETLRQHEAVEDDLFGEAFYLDIGGRA